MRHLDGFIHQIERRALDQLVSSPFCLEIEAVEASHKYSPSKFILYDGKSDPLTHISHYHQMMSLWNQNDVFMCKVFASSLGEHGLRWYDKLPPQQSMIGLSSPKPSSHGLFLIAESRRDWIPCSILGRIKRILYVNTLGDIGRHMSIWKKMFVVSRWQLYTSNKAFPLHISLGSH